MTDYQQTILRTLNKRRGDFFNLTISNSNISLTDLLWDLCKSVYFQAIPNLMLKIPHSQFLKLLMHLLFQGFVESIKDWLC